MKRYARCLTVLLIAVSPVFGEELEFEPYGYFKVDLAFDSALSSHGNFAMYVQPHAINGRTATTNITARQTRIGLKVRNEALTGRIEFDFYGGGPENKNLPMLRKAYVDVPVGGVTLRAGQAPDLMSPLVPLTLNYSVVWGAGNIGYRRPLVQVSDQSSRLVWGLAIARNIGGDLNGDSILDGDASCVPVVQGRLGVLRETTEFGVSGHYGLLKSDGAVEDEYNTWSVNADFQTQLTERFTVLAELYLGANSGAYFGAVLNGDCATDLESRGGWINLQARTSERTRLSLGYGIDDLTNERKTQIADQPNARSRNQVGFGNLTWDLVSGVRIGIELSRWETRYINVDPTSLSDPVNYRVQWSIQTAF